jgi:hypothetical protein
VVFRLPELGQAREVPDQQLDVEKGKTFDTNDRRKDCPLQRQPPTGKGGQNVLEHRHRLTGVRHPRHQEHEKGDGKAPCQTKAAPES